MEIHFAQTYEFQFAIKFNEGVRLNTNFKEERRENELLNVKFLNLMLIKLVHSCTPDRVD